MAHNFTQIGKPATRLDGQFKVTGSTRYAADIELPRMIWGKCLRSPYAHARIRAVDVSKAKQIKGVLAILTASDIPDRLIGRRLKDMPVLARDSVRFIGERVAVVAAETREIAEEALTDIRVDYEDLAAVSDPINAMAADAPILHKNLRSYENLRLPLPDIPNVHSQFQLLFGDSEKGFGESDQIFEQTFSTPRVHHGYLEPHAAVVDIDSSGRILVWCPAKGPYVTRTHLAEWLQVDEEKIVFQLSPVGGDFGGKASLMDIPLCYYLAKATNRPVKMIMSYAEELTAANPRHPATITIRTGVKNGGKLWAREVRAVFNSGAYAAFKRRGGPSYAAGLVAIGAPCRIELRRPAPCAARTWIHRRDGRPRVNSSVHAGRARRYGRLVNTRSDDPRATRTSSCRRSSSARTGGRRDLDGRRCTRARPQAPRASRGVAPLTPRTPRGAGAQLAIDA
jgi:CO/xanthine dehydrogenase Mo-binding subunit